MNVVRRDALRFLALLRPERARILLALCFTAVLACATAAFAYLCGPLLKKLLDGQSPRPIETLALAIFFIAIIKSAAQYAQSTLVQNAGAQITANLRRRIYEKLLALPPRFFQDKHSGELFSRFTNDVNQVENAVTVALVSYIKDPLTVVALLAMCAWLDGRLLLVLVVAVPLAVWPLVHFAKRLKRIAKASQSALGRLTERASEILSHVRIIQAYRQQKAELARFDRVQSIYLNEMRRSFFLRGVFTPVLELLGVAGLALAIFVAAHAIWVGTLKAPHLLSFLAAAMLLYQPVKALSTNGQLLIGALACAERLFEILDADPRIDLPEARPLPAFSREIRFEKVTFGYGEAPVLEGLDLVIRKGERVALVGPSGAGKSTLVNLLLGFWRPRSGEIFVDDFALHEAKLASWRSQLAIVGQEPVLFAMSIRDNVRAGRPEATEQEIREACEAAGAGGFIQSIPGGLDAPVGERGSVLSGGQRQRLVIARAFLRNAPILILDEPTSALDGENERLIEAALGKLWEARTSLIVAHRLSTIIRCDRIVVLDGGRIVDQGRHAELLQRGGLYARLWRSFSGAEAA